LYYFILFLSFILLPIFSKSFSGFFENSQNLYLSVKLLETDFLKPFLLFLFFLPNVALYFNGYVITGASQSWSVGVEEQFYLIWPFIFLLFNRKYWMYIFALIFCIMFVIAEKVTRAFPFEYMAIGAIGGYVNYYFKEKFKFLNSKGVYLLIITVLVLLLLYPFLKSVFYQSLVFAVFVVLLLIHTVNASHKLIFLSKPFNFLGNISYGIYMYHPIVMFFVFPFINSLKIKNSYLYNFSVYFLVFGFTFLISFLSYKYLEKRFILLKDFKFGAYNK
jgi:peptidoglycan/LPS O-acetylase OafA/YrhL